MIRKHWSCPTQAPEGASAFTWDRTRLASPLQVDGLEVREEKAGPGRLGALRRVLARRRRYLLDGWPVQFATSYLPLDIARGTQPRIRRPLRLEELGYHLNHFEKEIRARMPYPDEVRTPRLALGVPVFHLIWTDSDSQGWAGEVRETWWLTPTSCRTSLGGLKPWRGEWHRKASISSRAR
jgi:GntR family transcriptional regulator